ncbi:hypothetical protein BU25DRAFT_406302, partial [Macroventuria anomochaeta]
MCPAHPLTKGEPNDLAVVTCSGLSVNVTKNLRNALWRIRNSTDPKTIWADTLCMNQMDLKEISVHVPLMGRVFSQATNTVIYLGEASLEEAVAVEADLMAFLEFMVNLAMKPDPVSPGYEFGNCLFGVYPNKLLL